jgi:hypothetical protein
MHARRRRSLAFLLTMTLTMALSGAAQGQAASPDERARATERQMTDDELFSLAMALALLLVGCAPTWQAPAGMSPVAQASDRAACEEDARQAAGAQTGTGADAEVTRLQTLTQCLEARGWRLRRPAR